jgi:hypothetical protein
MGEQREDQRRLMVNSDEELIAALKKINETLKVKETLEIKRKIIRK